jgi:hypothetical protein
MALSGNASKELNATKIFLLKVIGITISGVIGIGSTLSAVHLTVSRNIPSLLID